MPRTIIGLMGAGDDATETDLARAAILGDLIAHRGWALLTGGRRAGVMHSASRAAKENGGLVIGVLPDSDTENMSEFVDIAIVTDMGSARNNINVLSSRVVIACGMGPGTASEVALALKAGKRVVLLCDDQNANNFFQALRPELVYICSTPEDVIEVVVCCLEDDIQGKWTRPARIGVRKGT